VTRFGIALSFALLSVGRSEDWPQFRGPTGDGQASVAGLPLTWSETENVKWKKDIHDAGWSTPVVMGGQVWQSVASSADGRNLIAAAYGDFIYTSTDYGANWTQQTGSGSQNWFCVASSSDGTKLIAGANPGHIYISSCPVR